MDWLVEPSLMLENALLRPHRSGAAGEAPTAELEDVGDLADWLLDDLE